MWMEGKTINNKMTNSIDDINKHKEKNEIHQKKLIQKINDCEKIIENQYKNMKKFKEKIKKMGLYNYKDIERLENIYIENKDHYVNINNINDLLESVICSQFATFVFLEENGFKNIEDLKTFIIECKNKQNIEKVLNKEKLITLLLPPKVTFNNSYKDRYIKLININRFNNYTKKCKYIECKQYISNSFEYCFNHFNKDEKDKHRLLDYNKYLQDVKENTPKKDNLIINKFKKSVKITILINNINKYIIDKRNTHKNNSLKKIVKKVILINRINKHLLEIKKKQKRKDYEKTNQNMKINNLLDKLLKSKNIGNKRFSYFYDIRKEKNKYLLKTYDYYYINKSKFSDEEKMDFLQEENINISNESRFNIYTKIFHKIYNNEIIKNSDFIFYPNSFKEINIKSIDTLLYKLEKLCINPDDIENIKNKV